MADVIESPVDTRSEAEVIAADAAGAVTGMPATPGPNQPRAPRERGARFQYKWMALAVVLCGSIMTILDATIVNIAIPTLQTAFNVRSYSDITWVVTAYLLAQGAVIPATGWATDRFGTKRLYMITLVLFTLASALCGLAPNLGMLIAFRVVQGIGGGMLMPIGMTIILKAVGPQQMGKVMGIFGVPMLLAPALGPVLGGWFVEDFSWRLIFYVNVPIGAVGLLAAWLLLRETDTSRHERLDWIGLLTGTPAVVALMYAVDRSNDLGWASTTVVSLLIASGVLFAAFLVRQLTAPAPLLHLRLFKDATFSWAMVLSFLVVTGLFGGMLLLPIFLQTVHHYDALHTGLILLPQAVTAAVFMPIAGQLTDRLGPRPVVLTGVVALAASGIVLAQLQPDSSLLLLSGGLVLRGAALGMAMMPTMSAALARVPRRYTSRASSVTNTLQRVSSSLGIALLVTFLGAQVATASTQAPCTPSPVVLASRAAHGVVGSSDLGSPVPADQLCGALRNRAASASAIEAGSRGPQQSAGHAPFDVFLADYGNHALSISFDRTFVFITVLSALGIIPALFLRRPEREEAGDAPLGGSVG